MNRYHYVTVAIDVRITDPDAFAAAAVKRAIEEGADPDEARQGFTVDNLAACAQMLLDPGTIGDGTCGADILQSCAE